MSRFAEKDIIRPEAHIDLYDFMQEPDRFREEFNARMDLNDDLFGMDYKNETGLKHHNDNDPISDLADEFLRKAEKRLASESASRPNAVNDNWALKHKFK